MPRKKQTTTTSKNCRKTKKRTGENPNKLPSDLTARQLMTALAYIINMLYHQSKNSRVNKDISSHFK